MKPSSSRFIGLLALVPATAALAQGTHVLNEGIWSDEWLGGYGSWLPLILAAVVCSVAWVASRKRRKK
jgi:threonine/homoserine efflux transporter RhtA